MLAVIAATPSSVLQLPHCSSGRLNDHKEILSLNVNGSDLRQLKLGMFVVVVWRGSR